MSSCFCCTAEDEVGNFLQYFNEKLNLEENQKKKHIDGQSARKTLGTFGTKYFNFNRQKIMELTRCIVPTTAFTVHKM